MSRKRGFRAAKNYDPNRGPKRAGGRYGTSAGRDDARQSPAPRDNAPRDNSPRKIFKPEAIELTVPDADLAFSDLGLGGNLIRALGELGAQKPFPIQSATIPEIIKGANVLGRASTGSGKTIAFGAGVVERLLRLKAQGIFKGDPQPAPKQKRGERAVRPASGARKPKALIIAPTRELALQLDETVQALARSVGFYTTQIVGGLPQLGQVHALQRGVDIVIGTPGRIEDLVRQRHLDLREVVLTVVDEADHMCELGFLEPVQRIMRMVSRNGQTLLFSATLDDDVKQIVDEFMPDHIAHNTSRGANEFGDIDHAVLVVSREDKTQVLIELLRGKKRALVFTRTKAFAEVLSMQLEMEGIKAISLHGDLSQPRRSRNLKSFSEGKARVLVATDVAARGIHVDAVDLVVQADPPEDYKTYQHRAGRTGRAGAGGLVVTLIARTRQKRTKEMLEEAQIAAKYFGECAPGETGRVMKVIKNTP